VLPGLPQNKTKSTSCQTTTKELIRRKKNSPHETEQKKRKDKYIKTTRGKIYNNSKSSNITLNNKEKT
jgi:hypothetical protein